MIGFPSNSAIICSRQSTLTAMKYSFYLKKDYKNKDNKYHLYINLSIHGERKRIPANLLLKKSEWDHKRQIVKNAENAYDFNLIIKDIKARINKIEIQYRLNNEVLTVTKCAELIQRPDLTVDFIAFFQYEMDLKNIEENSIKNHKSTLKKLKEFRKTLMFVDINLLFLKKYRNFLFYSKENQEVTIDNNMKIIKHYIKLAKKRGIKINVDLDEIKIKNHVSHRTNLTLKEVDLMKEYYFSKFIKEAHKRTLGYFLFNCHTGLRIQDLLKIKREILDDNFFNFWNQKSKKQQVLMTNQTCRLILEEDPTLFVKKITAKTINATIKDICKFLGIKKHVTCHVARHTFATNYLRKGGKIEDLQILLSHSDIKTTMIYVHIVETDVVKSMSLLD